VAGDEDNRGSERGPDGDAEFEPDYRFTLANERTFLAWQRTALGLLAAAVAVVHLVPDLTIPGAPRPRRLARGAGNRHRWRRGAPVAAG